MVETPQSCVPYQGDYKRQAWEAYTLAELGQWVHLFAKRAEHRTNMAKRDRDLRDAQNYLHMMQAVLNSKSQVTLASFSKVILDFLEDDTITELVDGTTEDIAYINWKLSDKESVSFERLYEAYLLPSLHWLKRYMGTAHRGIVTLPVDHKEGQGKICSVVNSDRMSIRLTTSYESGEDAGTKMSIEVGIK